MFIADYMENFECIGDRCEDTCCAGWGIQIDKSTYKKYQKVNTPQLRSIIKSNVKRIKKGKPNNESFATISLDKNNACPLLDRQGLCQIHSQLGEKALSKTCRTYPRVENWVDGMLEISATLSCPEAARLALLNKNGIGFKEQELKTDGHAIQHKIFTASATKNKCDAHLWQLQLACIELLKDRSIPLWKRVIQLGLICQSLANEQELSNHGSVTQTIETYRNLFKDPKSNQKIDNIEATPHVVMGVLTQFIDARQKAGTNQERFNECYDLAVQYLNGEDGSDGNIEQRYNRALENYYLPFFEEHEYILENYLVNYVFHSLFPTRPTNNPFENYITLVVNYSAIRLYLVGIAGSREEDFGVEDVLKFIQSFTKAVEHSSPLLGSIRDYFKEKELDSMAMMTILLKETPAPTTADNKEPVRPAFMLPC